MLQLPIRTYLLIEIEYKVKVFYKVMRGNFSSGVTSWVFFRAIFDKEKIIFSKKV